MVKIDWDKIYTKENENVEAITHIVATFIVHQLKGPDIKIEIHEYQNGQYIGISDYSIWGPDQAGPYKSQHPELTIEDAVDCSIKSLLNYINEKYSNEDIIWVKEDTHIKQKDLEYIDGNGCIINYEEVLRRRNAYKK